MNPHKALILRVMQEQRGDGLYRAEQAFRNCSPKEMQQEYGASGITKADLLARYRKHHDAFSEAIEWVANLPD